MRAGVKGADRGRNGRAAARGALAIGWIDVSDGARQRWQAGPPVGAPEARAVCGHGAAQVGRGPVLLAPLLPNLVLDGCRVQLLRDGLAAKERLQREVGEDEAPRVAGKLGDGVGHYGSGAIPRQRQGLATHSRNAKLPPTVQLT